jgi:uncharacterized protein YvpB
MVTLIQHSISPETDTNSIKDVEAFHQIVVVNFDNTGIYIQDQFNSHT